MRYSQIKQALKEAEIIDEVSMSPSSLEKFANSPEAEGMLIGIEWEMCVPNTNAGDDDDDWEPDYDQNQSASDIEDIINFFRNGDFSNMGRSDADRASSELWDEFYDWEANRVSDDIDSSDLDERVRTRLEEEYDLDYYMDDAREELGDDASDRAVEERASEIREAAIDSMIEDQDRSWQSAYDIAREELEEELRGSYYVSDWLSDIGVDDMVDAERRWGFSWPHMTSSGGYGDNDVDQVASDFTEATGYEAQGYNNYHAASRTDQQAGGYFIIEPDGSIDADSGDAGLEFISPAMPLKDGLAMIDKVKKWASSYGCYTNKSTGLHMNISVPDMTIENLDYVKLALFLGDEHVLREFDRTYNSYAKSAMKIVREKIQQNPENATALLAKMKEHVNAAASKLVHTGVTQKYTSINTKDKYVEFRGPGGDYLDQDIPKLVNTALRAAQALRIATDDSAYKQEYAKKLYKLVEPQGDWTDPNNSVALFSRYALGQINKAELVSNVRQAQVARKQKKGDEQQYWVMNKDESGGKQMVHATSETEAIIIGGKQMGMSREESISKLKAQLVYRQDTPMPRSVPENWQYWVKETLPNISRDRLASVRQRFADGGQEYGLEPDANNWLLRQVDDEMRSRMDAGASLDTGETRWKVYIARGEYAERPIDAVYVDADTPRQAKLKAAEIFTRQLNIVTLDTNDLEAEAAGQDEGREEQEWTVSDGMGRVAGTVNARSQDEALRIFGSTNNVDTRNYTAAPTNADTTNSREVVDSLPEAWQTWLGTIGSEEGSTLQRTIDAIANGTNPNVRDLSIEQRDAIIGTINVELRSRNSSREARNSLSQSWQTWLGQVGTHANETLENMLRTIEAGTGDVERMTPEQRNLITSTIEQELRSRSSTDYTAMANAANNAENTVRDSLPLAHRAWLDDVAEKTDMDLINVLRNVDTTSILNDQQVAYFRVTIKHELRRRGINPDSETAQAVGNHLQSQQVEPEVDLSSPDDEDIHDIMGGDEESAEQQWYRVGNHTYGRELLKATSQQDAINQFANRNNLTQAQVTDEPGFVAEPTDASELDESINRIRQLAGLK